MYFQSTVFFPKPLELMKAFSKCCGKYSKQTIAHQYCLLELEKITRLKPENEKEFVRQRNCILDVMYIGAACRKYNYLCAEDRMVAAILFPVD